MLRGGGVVRYRLSPYCEDVNTSPAAVSATLRKAGITTLPSGSPLRMDGVRVQRFMSSAVVTVSGPSQSTLWRCITEALDAAGYSIDKREETMFVDKVRG